MTSPIGARDPVRIRRSDVEAIKAYLVLRNTFGGLNHLIAPLNRALAHPRDDICACPTNYPGLGVGCPMHPEEVIPDLS